MIISDEVLRNTRKELDFQLAVPELREILATINPPLNFLIFGLGNDSTFWNDCNNGGMEGTPFPDTRNE